jgi:ADP-heptose:LPS heptosyltransferase
MSVSMSESDAVSKIEHAFDAYQHEIERLKSVERDQQIELAQMQEAIIQKEKEIADLKLQLEDLAESRKKLVVDITAERDFYERCGKRYEIQIAALNQRMIPFLKLEEANTVAEQLKTWNAMNKKPLPKRDEKKQQPSLRKHNRKTKPKKTGKRATCAAVPRTNESIDVHLL